MKWFCTLHSVTGRLGNCAPGRNDYPYTIPKYFLLKKLEAIKWTVITMHGIVFVFALFVFYMLANGNIFATLDLSGSDLNLRKALFLSALVMGGNMLGILLPFSSLFDSLRGNYMLVCFEGIFFIGSIQFLSVEYSVVIAISIIAYLYAIFIRKNYL